MQACAALDRAESLAAQIAADISLTDAQLSAIMAASQALQPPDRSSFLELVAANLQCQPQIGDGVVHQVPARGDGRVSARAAL